MKFIKFMRNSSDTLNLGDVRVLDNGLIMFRRSDDEVCYKKVIRVVNVVTSINDLSDQEVLKYLRTYFNSLNLGFPIEVRTIFKPIDKEKLLSEVNKKIQNLLVDIEVNPANTKAKTDLDRLTKFRDRIYKYGIQPYDVLAYYVVEACSDKEEEALKLVNSRASLLMKTLESLGIITSELKGVEGRALLQIFFRGYLSKFYELILNKLLRFKLVSRVASPLAVVFNPYIISSRTKFDLRSSGVYLGVNIITSENVFWNVERCLNPHILVIGPSGIGKTETLITILVRTHMTYSTKVFIVDVKNEYRDRLLRRGVKVDVINLGVDVGLGINQLINLIPKTFRASYLTEIISDSIFTKDEKDIVATLYKVLNEALEFSDINPNNFWGVIKDFTGMVDDDYIQYRLMRVFNILESLDRGVPLINVLRGVDPITPVNLSQIALLGIDYLNLAMLVLFNTIQILYMDVIKESHVPKIQVVVDEAWQFLMGRKELILKLLKLGRGYGVSLALATQSLHDLGELCKDYIENSGLLVVLPSSDTAYWKELSKFMKLSYDEIRDYTLMLSKGDALIRILPDPRPIPIKLDHEV